MTRLPAFQPPSYKEVLRDLLAAMAPMGIMTFNNKEDMQRNAELRYTWADEMIKAREKK